MRYFVVILLLSSLFLVSCASSDTSQKSQSLMTSGAAVDIDSPLAGEAEKEEVPEKPKKGGLVAPTLSW
jgi:ABC-type Fe3+-citrate transport system substrate-binding protein